MTKLEKIINIGNEWIKGDYHRVYFSTEKMIMILGLEIIRYNTGSISSAKLNGEYISNNKASQIIDSVELRKHYYDVKNNMFVSCYAEELNKYFNK
jgi:hypothetical protein